jgi:hypothetical protein
MDTDLVPPKLYTTPPEDAPPVEMVKVFTLDDRDYYIPKTPPASAVLAFMRVAQEEGEAAGNALLLRLLIGEENYAALESCPTLTFEQYGTIVTIVNKHSVGLFQRFLAASGNSLGG